MALAPAPAEVVVKAMVRGPEMVRVGEGRPLSPTEKAAHDLAKKATEGKWRQGLEETRSGEKYSGRVKKKVEEIGLDRRPDGSKIRSGDVKTRYDEASLWGRKDAEYVDKGYDAMADGDKAALRAEVAKVVVGHEQLKAEYDSLKTPKEKQEFLERILRDAKTNAVAEAQLKAIVESPPFGEITDLHQAMDTARPIDGAREDAQLHRDDVKVELDDIKAQLKDVDKQLADFQDRTLPLQDQLGDILYEARGARAGDLGDLAADTIGSFGFKAGTKFEILQTITRQEPMLRANAARATADIASRKERLTLLQQEKNTLEFGTRRTLVDPNTRIPQIEAEIIEIHNDITTLTQELKEAEAQLKVKELLEAEKRILDENKRTLEEKKIEKDKEFRRFDGTLNNANRGADTTNRLRAAVDQDFRQQRTWAEQELVQRFKEVIGNSAQEWVNGQTQELTNIRDQQLAELKAKTTGVNEKVVIDALEHRWKGKERAHWYNKNDKYRPIDKAQVNADFRELISPQVGADGLSGPDRLMKHMLEKEFQGQKDPETGTVYSAIAGQPGHAELQKRVTEMMQNKELVDKMRPELVKTLIARKMAAGGIRPEHVDTIVFSSWGGGMIEAGVAKHDEYKKAVDALAEKNGLTGESYLKKVQHWASKNQGLALITIIPGLLAAFSMKASDQDITA